MKQRRVIIFCIVMAAQLYVLVGMIVKEESVLSAGKVFRFRIAPVDPVNPLMGNYLQLNFEEENFTQRGKHDWKQHERVYAAVQNERNFARIIRLSRQPFSGDTAYFETKIKYMYSNGENGETSIHLQLPFDRYYIAENKSDALEDRLNGMAGEARLECYAEVVISEGVAVLKDLHIP